MKTKPCPTCGGTGQVPRYPTVKLATKARKSWLDNFPKSPWPVGDDPFHWSKLYFTLGDRIEWKENPWMPKTEPKVKSGRVVAIKKNVYGRIGYHAGGGTQQIMIEDVARAEPREVPRSCVP